MPMNCDGGDDQPVVMIITNQVAVETVALCAEHFVEWVFTTYGAMTADDSPPEPAPAPPTPVDPSAADVRLPLDMPHAGEGEPPPAETTPRRGRKPRTAASAS